MSTKKAAKREKKAAIQMTAGAQTNTAKQSGAAEKEAKVSNRPYKSLAPLPYKSRLRLADDSLLVAAGGGDQGGPRDAEVLPYK